MSKPIPTKVAPIWRDVPYLETTDRVVGGLTGTSNLSAVALAERTDFIKKKLDTVVSDASLAAVAATEDSLNTLVSQAAQAAAQANAQAINTLVGSAVNSAISTEVSARQAADISIQQQIAALPTGNTATIQAELNATQASAGINIDGTWTAPTNTAYIGASSNLKDMGVKLDAAIKETADAVGNKQPILLPKRANAAYVDISSVYVNTEDNGAGVGPIYQRDVNNAGADYFATVRRGTGVPTVPAQYIGQMYVDESVARLPYFATNYGTGVTDWKPLVNDSSPYEKWSNSIGDNSTVNTTVIQDEINALGIVGGGTLKFKPGIHITGPLQLVSNVVITGVGASLKCITGGVILTAEALTNSKVINITLLSSGSGTNLYECGIKVISGSILIANVTFEHFNDEAIWLDSASIACKILNCYAGDSLMYYARSSRSGVFRISGTDHQFFNNEIGSAQNWLPPATSPGNGWMSITSTNLFNCGYFITGANCFFSINRAQNVDVGWWVDSTSSGFHRFDGNRGDLNWAHSFVNEANNSVIVNHFAQDISLQGTGLYSAIKTSGQNNHYSNCHGQQDNRNLGPTYGITYPSYAFEDTVSAGEFYQRNVYSNCRGQYSIALAKTSAWEGSTFIDPNTSVRKTTYPTLDSNGTSFLVCAHTVAGEITSITGNTNGKILTILSVASVAVTIKNGGNIFIHTGSDLVLGWGKPERFISYNDSWFLL